MNSLREIIRSLRCTTKRGWYCKRWNRCRYKANLRNTRQEFRSRLPSAGNPAHCRIGSLPQPPRKPRRYLGCTTGQASVLRRDRRNPPTPRRHTEGIGRFGIGIRCFRERRTMCGIGFRLRSSPSNFPNLRRTRFPFRPNKPTMRTMTRRSPRKTNRSTNIRYRRHWRCCFRYRSWKPFR